MIQQGSVGSYKRKVRGFKDVNCEVFRMELMAENVDIHELAGVKREDEQRTTEYSL